MYESLKIDQLGSIYDRFTLKGKKALVTGAGGGIGRSTANAFAEMGADVALMDIPEKMAQLKETADFIANKHGVKAIPVVGNVADDASVKAFVGEVVDAFGTLDVVHSNAGIAGGVTNGSDLDIEVWNRIVAINLTGMLLVGREGANVMKKHGHGGSIIFTSSMSGHIINRVSDGGRYPPGYTATKAGVRHLAKSMALDYVKQGIRFNSVSPGMILSGLHDGWDPKILEAAAQQIPMERFGDLDDIVGVVCFLASDLSSYSTGSDIICDGGYTVW